MPINNLDSTDRYYYIYQKIQRVLDASELRNEKITDWRRRHFFESARRVGSVGETLAGRRGQRGARTGRLIENTTRGVAMKNRLRRECGKHSQAGRLSVFARQESWNVLQLRDL